MKDIYPIMPLIVHNNLFLFSIILALILLVIFLDIFYKNQIQNSNPQNISLTNVKRQNLENKILYLQDNLEKFSENEFYKILYETLLSFLKEKYNLDISNSQSFKEIKSKFNQDKLLDLLEKIYYKQYVLAQDNFEERKKILWEIELKKILY